MLRTARPVPASSTATMPADSCPRCCSEYNPRCTSLAASDEPRTPKIPHMSETGWVRVLLEDRRFGRRRRHEARDGAMVRPRQLAEGDIHLAARRGDREAPARGAYRPDPARLHAMARGDIQHGRRIRRAHHDARLRLAKQQRAVRQCAPGIELHRGADWML